MFLSDKFIIIAFFVLFDALETSGDGNFSQWDIHCEQTVENNHVYCGIFANKLSNTIPTIPIEKISKEVKVLRAHLSLNVPWLINDHTMFHRFSDLSELILVGPVKFSSTYDDPIMKKSLVEKLFDLPSLNILGIWYWKLDHSYTWTFSRNLESLTMLSCIYTELDLSSNPNLIHLNIRSCNLSTMPKLSTPRPPLKTLNLVDNPNIKFTAADLLHICTLDKFSIKTFNRDLNQSARYCECNRLKKYLQEFDIVDDESFVCEDLTDDCNDYPVEHIIEEHRSFCGQFWSRITNTTEFPTRPQPTTAITIYWQLINQTCPECAECAECNACLGPIIGSIVLFAILVTVIAVCVCILYKNKLLSF